ncbi:MAG TPA: glycosyltransferase family 39 protein [Thermoanaerobaculia bacterium]|nr:glycosyltransferase family 39 protein [Thermoanaerobaculia bacterium]
MTDGATSRLERWLGRHDAAVAAALVALGAAARIRAARAPFLTPDEALHLAIANSGSAVEVYRTSLYNAHPPLFVLLLRLWKSVVTSDWALRLLPVLFGTLFLWAAYRWTRRLLGPVAALWTLVFMAFLPSLVLVTSELRGYALLLCATAAALACLERALDEGSAPWMGAFAALAAAALLSHYAAFRFVAAALAYSAVRVLAPPRSPKRLAAWASAFAALTVLSAFLAATHVSHLRGGALEAEARATWLKSSYFDPASGGAAAFLGRQTLALFAYLFSTPATAVAALVLFAAGIGLLAVRRNPAALLLVLPFVLAAVGGLVAVYPYGGSRHSIDLAPFLAAAMAFALSRLTGGRLWPALAAAVALAPAAFFAAG